MPERFLRTLKEYKPLNMKPNFCFVLSAFLSAVFVGCGSSKSKDASASDDTAASSDSFEESVDAGMTASRSAR